jgi:hypothetical protein
VNHRPLRSTTLAAATVDTRVFVSPVVDVIGEALTGYLVETDLV